MRIIKLVQPIAALTLACALAACSSGAAKQTQTLPPASGAKDPANLPDNYAKGLKFSYLSAPLGDVAYARVACGAQIEAKRIGADLDH
ncbi:MAG: hypothetical protein J2P17_29430, partial [Mycobacterium sp.]|nr:hypothetical protein [Mycobacterium sp.]